MNNDQMLKAQKYLMKLLNEKIAKSKNKIIIKREDACYLRQRLISALELEELLQLKDLHEANKFKNNEDLDFFIKKIAINGAQVYIRLNEILTDFSLDKFNQIVKFLKHDLT